VFVCCALQNFDILTSAGFAGDFVTGWGKNRDTQKHTAKRKYIRKEIGLNLLKLILVVRLSQLI